MEYKIVQKDRILSTCAGDCFYYILNVLFCGYLYDITLTLPRKEIIV
jgi:hypothetical protein